jgi:hypothetical protein
MFDVVIRLILLLGGFAFLALWLAALLLDYKIDPAFADRCAMIAMAMCLFNAARPRND